MRAPPPAPVEAQAGEAGGLAAYSTRTVGVGRAGLDRAAERGGGVPPPQGGPVWMCGPSGGGVTAVAMALFLWQWEGRGGVRVVSDGREVEERERERGRARAGRQWEARAVTGTVCASAARSTRHPARRRSGPHLLHDTPPRHT